MAADREVMRAVERLRLDRPGRAHKAAASGEGGALGGIVRDVLAELAATYREEAELWTRSGARGWKSSEADALTVADAIDVVAAQLDNADGGAALSVSDPVLDDTIEAELRASAARIDGVRDLAGLDRLIADSVAERRGFVRDNLLPEGHPAKSHTGDVIDKVLQNGGTLTRHPTGDLSLRTANGNDVTAYLTGETNDIPGTPPLSPGSVTGAPELDNPFACSTCGNTEPHGPHESLPPGDTTAVRPEVIGLAGAFTLADEQRAKLDSLPGFTATMTINGPAVDGVVPATWSSDTMTADGLRVPGAPAGAPLLGQPGDAGSGYSHAYVPAGGRKITYVELLTPVPASALPPHLSNSQIDTVGDCPARYRMQRVELLPQVPQWANVGGSAFHAAVEVIERTMIRGPFNLAAIDVEQSWADCFDVQIDIVRASSPVPVSVWRAARRGAEGRQWWEVNGPLMLRRYLDTRPDEPTMDLPHAHPEVGAGMSPGIEYETTVHVPTPYGPIPFVAKIDRITVGHVPGHPERGALIIRDYKSSYERPTDTTQLGDYAHALRLHFAENGGGPLAAVPIYGTYFDARRGEWTTPVDLLEAHPFEAFQYRVTAAHAQKLALTTGPTPARVSSYCGGCAVRYACPIMAAKS